MDQLTRIRPDDRLQEGMVSATRHIVREALQHRDHIRAGFRQDFANLYHGTFFGVLWNIILPLVPISVYVFLSLFRIFPAFEGVNPATYVALGATVWFLLTGCIQRPLESVRSRNVEVMKTAVPLSAAVLSGFAQLLFDTFIRGILVLLVILVTATDIRWTAILAPFGLIPAVMACFGVGLILGIANVIYSDVAKVTNIALQYGIFVSGVIFPVYQLPFSNVLVWSPAYVLIEHLRILFFRGWPESWWIIGSYWVAGVVVFMLGCRIFYVMEYRVRGIA